MLRIALIGLPGSGKSTQAQRLSQALNLPLFDTDALFEAESGRRIADVFAAGEEAHFRDWEQQWLNQLSQLPSCVLSTGGGMPCQPKVMAQLNQFCLTIWLQLPVPLIWQRLQQLSHPLLHQHTAESFDKLSQSRESYYRQAQIHLNASGTPEEVQENLRQMLNLD